MKQYKNIMAQLPGNAEDMGTCGGIQSTGFLFPTMKPLDAKADAKREAAAPAPVQQAPALRPERALRAALLTTMLSMPIMKWWMTIRTNNK